MPGVYQQSAIRSWRAREVESLGIPGIILFGLPNPRITRHKFPPLSVVQRALKRFAKQN